MRVGPAQHDPIRGLDSIHSVACHPTGGQCLFTTQQVMASTLPHPIEESHGLGENNRPLSTALVVSACLGRLGSELVLRIGTRRRKGGIVSESDALNGPTCAAALTCLPPVSLNLPNHQAPTRGRYSIPASTVSVELPTSGFTNERPLFLASFGS
jgi:hypothetical protein